MSSQFFFGSSRNFVAHASFRQMSRGNEPVGIKAETMSDKPAYLTRDGRAKLEAELEDLIINGRKVVAERIGAAKELGDISESGEYEDAKNQQAHLEGRIREVKSILSRAQIIDEENGHGH